MRFAPTSLAGVHLLALEPAADERGTFVRYFDATAFAERGLQATFELGAVATNLRAGTLRGLHFAAAPFEEVKIVRCTRGAAFDVLLDVRPDSATYGRWQAFELDASRTEALYVPAGIAHGYQTRVDDTTLEYLISAPYDPAYQRGVRWDSPALAIPWPAPPVALSARDLALEPFAP